MTPSLARHPFCADLRPEQLDTLSACASEVTFAPGQVIARQGQRADATYLVIGGRVALKAGDQVVETVEEDELLGWSWMFEGTTWHVDAVATGAVRAIRLDGACLDARMKADPSFGHSLSRCFLHQIHHRLERARLRSLDVFGAPR